MEETPGWSCWCPIGYYSTESASNPATLGDARSIANILHGAYTGNGCVDIDECTDCTYDGSSADNDKVACGKGTSNPSFTNINGFVTDSNGRQYTQCALNLVRAEPYKALTVNTAHQRQAGVGGGGDYHAQL